jgi:hypothetical protein
VSSRHLVHARRIDPGHTGDGEGRSGAGELPDAVVYVTVWPSSASAATVCSSEAALALELARFVVCSSVVSCESSLMYCVGSCDCADSGSWFCSWAIMIFRNASLSRMSPPGCAAEVDAVEVVVAAACAVALIVLIWSVLTFGGSKSCQYVDDCTAGQLDLAGCAAVVER